MNDHKSALVGIFEKAGEAHAFAYAEAGENNDWAIWYADFLRGPLSKALGRDFTVAELTVCLMIAEDERLAMHGPDHPWPRLLCRSFPCPLYAPEFRRGDETVALLLS